MKDYIIAFFIALVATSWVYTTGSPPQGVPVVVKDVQEATKRRTYEPSDSTFDNFKMVDSSIDKTIMTNVVDRGASTGTHQTVPYLGAEH